MLLHDDLVSTCRYDFDAVAAQDAVSPAFSANGALVNGMAVCQGYAKAFQLLCREAGIECRYVAGSAGGQASIHGSHAWNIVRIDGAWYHVDVTFDDPTTAQGGDLLRHDFFNVDDDTMLATHRWDRELHPPCESMDNNYYVASGALLRSGTDLRERIRSMVASGDRNLEVRVKSKPPSETVVKAWVEEAWMSAGLSSSVQVSLCVDPLAGTVWIELV